MRGRRTIRPETSLLCEVDPEERFEAFPSHYTMKGMFFSRMLELGGHQAFERVQARLVRPPSWGRYLPFSDYPQVDYSRIAHAAAVSREPGCDVVEAMRRLARHDIRTFAQSSVGGVMLALVANDPVRALLKLPEMYGASLKGGEVRAKLDGRVVVLEYLDFFGWLDCYPIGHIEGLAMHFQRSTEIEVVIESATRATYRATLV